VSDKRDRLVSLLRGRFTPPLDMSDDELLTRTEGLYGRALVELSMSIDDLQDAVMAALPPWLRRTVKQGKQGKG
jgi:hypothetical protein